MDSKDNSHNAHENVGGKSGDNAAILSLTQIFLPYVRKLWAVRRNFIVTNMVVLLMALVVLFVLVQPYYESTVTILPDYGAQSSMMSSLGGLAAIAGLSIGAADPSDIYKNLLTSETVVEPVLYARYYSVKLKDTVNLFTCFGIGPDSDLPVALQQREMFIEAYNRFTKSVADVSVDLATKILTVRVRMPESKLSMDIANNLAESLDSYVRTKKKSNASMQRFYIEKRVSEVKDSLTILEDNLTKFQQSNRVLTQSPELAMEQSRLSLKVQILQGVYSQLVTQLEIAKIEEIRNAPIVNIRELARDPIIKAGPKRTLLLFVIMFLSFLFSTTYFLSQDSLRSLYKNIVDVGRNSKNDAVKES
jgi:capsule polysaccharide export protein KpsE/RkpR